MTETGGRAGAPIRGRGTEESLDRVRRFETLGRIAACVAHDFNNLLTAVHGACGLALEDTPADHPARPMLETAVRASEQAAALADQFLGLMNSEKRGPATTQVAGVVHSLERLLRCVLGPLNRLELELDLDPAGGYVLADRAQLEQVLINLACNARDAMVQGGTLRVIVRKRAPADPAEPGAVRILVEDTGHGMNADVLPRIFEPFFTTKKPGRGTGLGLVSVRASVERWGGTITVSSEPDRGASFLIEIPCTDTPLASTGSASTHTDESSTHPAAPPAAALPATILVVDDEPDIERLITCKLLRLGYWAISAAGPIEALSAASKVDRVDLLITDLSMPKMTGGELAREVRRLHPQASVIVMTGWDRHDLPGSEPQELPFPIVTKPISLDGLARTVAQVLFDRRAGPGGAVTP